MKNFNNIVKNLHFEECTNYETKKIKVLLELESISFCNWVHIQGWYYSIDGFYNLQSFGNTIIKLSPKELYDTYKKQSK